MKAIIEYSDITRHYYVKLGSRRSKALNNDWFTRKDVAEREAKKAGATEIEHFHRSTTQDLRDIGFSADVARRVAKMY